MIVKVLIVDDHRLVADGIRHSFERAGGFEVVGQASSAAEAMEMVESLGPALVTLDISMPGGSGLAVLGALTTRAKVVVVTMYDDAAFIKQALQLGAAGYVLKDAPDAELLTAARAVLAGRTYVDPRLAPALSQAPTRRTFPIGPALSKRETQVLQLLSLGHTNQEIAAQLVLSLRTVETYKERLCAKLGLTTRAELVGYAREHGLI